MKRKLHRNRYETFFWACVSEMPKVLSISSSCFNFMKETRKIWSCSIARLAEVGSFWNLCPIWVKTRNFPKNWFSTVLACPNKANISENSKNSFLKNTILGPIWGPGILLENNAKNTPIRRKVCPPRMDGRTEPVYKVSLQKLHNIWKHKNTWHQI